MTDVFLIGCGVFLWFCAAHKAFVFGRRLEAKRTSYSGSIMCPFMVVLYYLLWPFALLADVLTFSEPKSSGYADRVTDSHRQK